MKPEDTSDIVRKMTGASREQPGAPPLDPIAELVKETEELGLYESTGFKADSGKDPWELLPWDAVTGIVKVLKYGLNKYVFQGSGRKPDNWRYVENGTDRYFAAAIRHIVAWRMGEKNDPESGLPHLWHALCNLTFLVELDK